MRKSLSERISDAVLGVKGSLLRDTNTASDNKTRVVEENPMARLKLLLVSQLVSLGRNLLGK